MEHRTPGTLIAALSLLSFLMLGSCVAPTPAEGPQAAEIVEPWRFGTEPIPSAIRTIPTLEVQRRHGEAQPFAVVLSNPGPGTLTYSGYGPDHPRLFWETLEEGAWRRGRWDWCGTGAGSYRLPPGSSLTLAPQLFGDADLERVLIRLVEEGTNRASMVVLLYSLPTVGT